MASAADSSIVPLPPRSSRSESPQFDTSPTAAIGACPELSRCVSTASSMSHGSSSDGPSRESLGSDSSRQSSGSYHRRSDVSSLTRTSSGEGKHGRRRGYMRPQGTDFAASAKSRESVMSLGSIAHLQYYFARTGLLDGKGGQLARKKKDNRGTLDLSALETTSLRNIGAGHDSSYTSMGGSPDIRAQNEGLGIMIESPVEDNAEEDYFEDSFASDPGMLPPTVSTYHHKQPAVPKPPTIEELKVELETTLANAAQALREVEERKTGSFEEAPTKPKLPNMPEENSQGWYELQGMHILDVVTLAIRSAKLYYTAHELPDRLDMIKPEKQVRADLLAVMEVLKQMATRGFRGGIKDEECRTMSGWVESVFGILREEEKIEAAEQAEHASWTWLGGNWTGRELERERAFLASMDPDSDSLPEWSPVSDAADIPTPFLQCMQNGVRLIKLHNALVKRSRRRFGAIPTFHTDTQKPYRAAENLRYWVKAAELRFEVFLSVDPLGIVYNSGPQVWRDFESAILKWSSHVREEVTKELGR